MNPSSEHSSTSTEFAEVRTNHADDLQCPDTMQMHLSVPGDDRYPGTFFRLPRMPVPGKTSWSLTK
jgi:hypothetical protein